MTVSPALRSGFWSSYFDAIKNSKIIKENPITAEKNYILVWGDNI